MSPWLSDNEKYALIALEVRVDQHTPLLREVAVGYWAWTYVPLKVPLYWREWLGTIQTEAIENSNLILLCKTLTKTSAVLDAENELLKRRVWGFYIGLLLSSTFTLDRPPVMLTGAQTDGEWDIRQQNSLDLSSANLIRAFAGVHVDEVGQAARFGGVQEQLIVSPPLGGPWRLLRVLQVYVAARQTREVVDRLHQFCRCIDGLILSEPGKGAKQFKSRTELFIGPRHHELMGQLYKMRSDIEHLHEHKYLEVFDRLTRLDLAEKAAIAEHIARYALGHILSTSALWPHFGNSTNLASFWQLNPADRQKLWGPAMINPADAIAGYDPDTISDIDLGKRP
jgi:hypothetical protein